MSSHKVTPTIPQLPSPASYYGRRYELPTDDNPSLPCMRSPDHVLVLTMSHYVVGAVRHYKAIRAHPDSERHSYRYCCDEHMRRDWQEHKNYCVPFVESRPEASMPGGPGRQVPLRNESYPNFTTAPSPGENTGSRGQPTRSYTVPLPPGSRATTAPEPTGNATSTTFQAVLFPYNEDRPRLVEVPCLAQPQSSGPTIWTPMPQGQLGGVQEITSMIITHGVGGAPLRFPLHLFYGTNSFGDGSPVNQVIARMTAGRSTYQWAGEESVLCVVAFTHCAQHFRNSHSDNHISTSPLAAFFWDDVIPHLYITLQAISWPLSSRVRALITLAVPPGLNLLL